MGWWNWCRSAFAHEFYHLNTSSMVACVCVVWSAFVFWIYYVVVFVWLVCGLVDCFLFKCLILLCYNVRYPFYCHYHTILPPPFICLAIPKRTFHAFFRCFSNLNFCSLCCSAKPNWNEAKQILSCVKYGENPWNKRHKEWNQHSLGFSLCVCTVHATFCSSFLNNACTLI